MVRYDRDDEVLANELKRARADVRDVQRPTGTEKAQTMLRAEAAFEESQFAKELGERLEVDLGVASADLAAAKAELGEAKADAQSALTASGLARAEAAAAVADAQSALVGAADALARANTARAEAASAVGQADTAVTTSNTARAEAASAVADAQAALVDAASAVAAAGDAVSQAGAASTTASLADGKLTLSPNAPTAANGSGKPVGALWMRQQGGAFTGMWEWTSLGWIPRPLSETIIPKIAIGSGTYGEMHGSRLTAGSVMASSIAVGDFSNLATIDPVRGVNVTRPAGFATKTDGIYTTRGDSPAGNYLMFKDRTDTVPFKGGEELLVSFRARATSPSSAWFTLWGYPDKATGGGAGNQSVSSSAIDIDATERAFSITLRMPAGFNEATPFQSWMMGLLPQSGTDMANVGVRDVRVYRKNAGEMIVDGAVTAGKIAAGSVTADKIVAGAVVAEKIASNAVTADKIIANAVTAVKIAANAVTATKIAADAVTSEKIIAGAITTTHIMAQAVTAVELAANAVTAVKIAANAVTAEKINAGAVTADKITAGAVNASKLAAASVTADKIVAGAVTAAKIAAKAVSAAELTADAIDGMTVTGATIRTAPSGRRVQLDNNGLRAFNTAGQVTAALSAGNGSLGLSGDMEILGQITASATPTDGDTRRDLVLDGKGYKATRVYESPGSSGYAVGTTEADYWGFKAREVYTPSSVFEWDREVSIDPWKISGTWRDAGGGTIGKSTIEFGPGRIGIATREISINMVPIETQKPQNLTLTSAFTNAVGTPSIWMTHSTITLVINAFREGWNNLQTITTIPDWARPPASIPFIPANVSWGDGLIEVKIYPDGRVTGQPMGGARNGATGTITWAKPAPA